MTAPPIFTDADGNRWSIGSRVVVYWFEHAHGADGQSVNELSAECIVSGLTADGSGGWIVTVTFGPLLDLMRKTSFLPTQVCAVIEPSCGHACGDD